MSVINAAPSLWAIVVSHCMYGASCKEFSSTILRKSLIFKHVTSDHETLNTIPRLRPLKYKKEFIQKSVFFCISMIKTMILLLESLGSSTKSRIMPSRKE